MALIHVQLVVTLERQGNNDATSMIVDAWLDKDKLVHIVVDGEDDPDYVREGLEPLQLILNGVFPTSSVTTQE